MSEFDKDFLEYPILGEETSDDDSSLPEELEETAALLCAAFEIRTKEHDPQYWLADTIRMLRADESSAEYREGITRMLQLKAAAFHGGPPPFPVSSRCQLSNEELLQDYCVQIEEALNRRD